MDKEASKFMEYFSQHVEILTFLLDNGETLGTVMRSDYDAQRIIIDFFNKLGECSLYMRKIENFKPETDNLLDFMEPLETMKMMGKLAEVFEMADVIMGLYLKYNTEGGGNNE